MEKKPLRLVVFDLHQESYALNYFDIERIIPWTPLLPMPHLGEKILGILEIDKQFVPILDLEKRLGFNKTIRDSKIKAHFFIFIVNLQNKEFGLKEIGFVAENPDYIEIREDKIETIESFEKNVEDIQDSYDTILIKRIIKLKKTPKPIQILNVKVALFFDDSLLLQFKSRHPRKEGEGIEREAIEKEIKQNLEILKFKIGKTDYGIESKYIDKVYPIENYIPLSSSNEMLKGLFNLRGFIIGVLDLKKCLNINNSRDFNDTRDPKAFKDPKAIMEKEKQSMSEKEQLIVLKVENMIFAVSIDEIDGIVKIQKDHIETLPMGEISDYVKGITKHNIIIIDILKLVANERLLIDEPG